MSFLRRSPGFTYTPPGFTREEGFTRGGGFLDPAGEGTTPGPVNTVAPVLTLTGTGEPGDSLSWTDGTWTTLGTISATVRSLRLAGVEVDTATPYTVGTEDQGSYVVRVSKTDEFGSRTKSSNIITVEFTPVELTPGVIEADALPPYYPYLLTAPTWDYVQSVANQWYLNGSPESGQTGTAYTGGAVNGDDLFLRTTATNGAKSATSDSNELVYSDGSAPPEIDLFVMAGQSNMIHGDYTLAPTPPASAIQWSPASGIEAFQMEAANDATGSMGSGPTPKLATDYAAATGRNACYVLGTGIGGTAQVAAADGGPGNFDTSGTLRAVVVSRANAAKAALEAEGYTVIMKGIVWSQGEQDALKVLDGTITKAQYKTALETMIAYYQTNIEANLPFYIIRTGERTGTSDAGGVQIRAAQDEVAAADADVTMATQVTLSFVAAGLMDDTVHYSQAGQNIVGRDVSFAVTGVDVTAPALTSATIVDDVLTLVFNEAVTQGSGYADSDINLDMSTTGTNIAVTYASGDGTDTHVYTAASAAVHGETVDLDFNGASNSLEDASGNDLASITSGAVTNNTPAVASNPGTTNLTAWWNSDETGTPATILADIGTYNLTTSGSPSGGQTRGTHPSGIAAAGVAYDGTNDSATQTTPIFYGVTPFTLGAWIYCDSAATTPMIATKYDNTAGKRGFMLYLSSGGFLTAVVSGDGTATLSTAGTVNLVGGWHFVTMTFIGSTSLTLHVDGVQISQNTTSIPATVFRDDTVPFYLGRRVAGNYFDGMILSAFYYSSRALDDSEISWLYNAGAGRQFADL